MLEGLPLVESQGLAVVEDLVVVERLAVDGELVECVTGDLLVVEDLAGAEDLGVVGNLGVAEGLAMVPVFNGLPGPAILTGTGVLVWSAGWPVGLVRSRALALLEAVVPPRIDPWRELTVWLVLGVFSTLDDRPPLEPELELACVVWQWQQHPVWFCLCRSRSLNMSVHAETRCSCPFVSALS